MYFVITFLNILNSEYGSDCNICIISFEFFFSYFFNLLISSITLEFELFQMFRNYANDKNPIRLCNRIIQFRENNLNNDFFTNGLVKIIRSINGSLFPILTGSIKLEFEVFLLLVSLCQS